MDDESGKSIGEEDTGARKGKSRDREVSTGLTESNRELISETR